MTKPSDPLKRDLLAAGPADWLWLAGWPARGPVRLVEEPASPTTGEDTFLWVDEPQPWLARVDFEASQDRWLADRLLRENVVTGSKYELPVRSLAILLRQEAEVPGLNGKVEWRWPGKVTYLTFLYDVVRVWTIPASRILEGPLALLPLAPLARVSVSEAAKVVARMRSRIRAEASPEEAARLWSSISILLGLKYSVEMADVLLRGVKEMEESSTYQAILRKGEALGETKGAAIEARRLIIRLGTRKLGDPDLAIRDLLDSIDDIDALERMIDRLDPAKQWSDLLGPTHHEPDPA